MKPSVIMYQDKNSFRWIAHSGRFFSGSEEYVASNENDR